MMLPKYSIIIPAHNAEDCLGRCLDSVVSQKYRNWELLVVCDACTDGTADVVRKYGEKPIIVNHQRDGLPGMPAWMRPGVNGSCFWMRMTGGCMSMF